MRFLRFALLLFFAPAAFAQFNVGVTLSRVAGSSSEPILLSPQPDDETTAWSAYLLGLRLGYEAPDVFPLGLALNVQYGPSSEIQETTFPSTGSPQSSVQRSLSLLTVRPEVTYVLQASSVFSVRAGAYVGYTRASVSERFAFLSISEDETVWNGATAGLTSDLVLSLNNLTAVSVGTDIELVRPDIEIIRARIDTEQGTRTFYAPISFDVLQPQISVLLRF